MVSTKIKKIKGKKYVYAEYSFRLADGKIKKLSKLIRDKNDKDSKKVKDYFLDKEIEAYQHKALEKYSSDIVLTKDKILKLESIRVKYKKLVRSFTKKQISDILDRFAVNFTYESNAIEGNSLTLKDVTLLLHERLLPKNKDLREVYETRNTRAAMDLLFSNKVKIDIKNIIFIHSTLVKETGVSIGLKKIPNFIVMSNLKTTPPEKVEKEMKSLIKWYHDSKDKLHPLKLASDFHGRFERIHPFEDGNGRVGRILVNAILLENDYPPLIIRKTMRISYFSALEAFDNKYTLKLERFFFERIEKTFDKFFNVYVKYM